MKCGRMEPFKTKKGPGTAGRHNTFLVTLAGISCRLQASIFFDDVHEVQRSDLSTVVVIILAL